VAAELLKQIAPGVTRVAVIRDPTTAVGLGQFGAIQVVARVLTAPVNRSVERKRAASCLLQTAAT
jgi:hypothetical protein